MTKATFAGAQGLRLRLRLITLEDAQFVYRLRVDPQLSRHLSPVSGGIEAQREWINRYKARESARQEYYYIICRKSDDRPCGTVRLYDLEQNALTWGSWILDADRPAKAALESALLSFSIAFEVLNKQVARVDVEKANHHAIAFYRRFGMTETGKDGSKLLFDYSRTLFEEDREGLAAALNANGLAGSDHFMQTKGISRS